MTVNFYLDTTSSAVLLVVGHKGKKFRVSTGHVIKPTIHWNQEEQKVKSSFPDYKSINDELESKKSFVKKIISNYKITHNTVPALDYVKQELSTDPNTKTDKTFSTLLALFEANAKENLKKSTGYIYKAFVAEIKKFQDKEKLPLSFEIINTETIERYKKYLRNKKNSPYTIKNKLHLFKIFLNFGIKNEYLKEFNEHLFEYKKAPKGHGDKIYLPEEKLELLEKLTALEPLDEIVRDGFLFQCYTGLRFSDLKTLKAINISNGLIRVVMHKTENSVFIPISQKAQTLLNKYKENGKYCIPLPNKDIYNVRIKEICKIAGVTEKIEIIRYEGNTRIEEIVFKYELVASHTGRRTFATLYILRGGQIEILSKLLGHSDITVTWNYFRDTPEVIAILSKRFVEPPLKRETEPEKAA